MKSLEITFIHVFGIWTFLPESLDPTFIQNKVVVVRKISIVFRICYFEVLQFKGHLLQYSAMLDSSIFMMAKMLI